MSKKMIWLAVSFLMVLSLVLSSCAPAVAPEEEVITEEEEAVTVVEEEVIEEVVVAEKEYVVNALGKNVEKPRYGGVCVQALPKTINGFDAAHGVPGNYYSQKLTNESLVIGDWLAGMAGRGETYWVYHSFPAPDRIVGSIAESWERPDDTTMVFYIRKGIRWAPADKAPTYGRELTADDVAFSLRRMFQTDSCYVYHGYPWDIYVESIEAESWQGSDANFTVVVKSKPDKLGFVWEMVSMYGGTIVPRDAIEYYGDFGDWQDAIGTGPFILTDYVPGSQVTMERNPNYWGNHPLYPDMQMPFLDGYKLLIIPDVSTRLAGLRTGKIDWFGERAPDAIEWEDAAKLMESNSDLQYLGYPGGVAPALWYRVDKPELPFYDVNVRKALNMAVDQAEIRDTYYGGNAELINWPIAPIPAYADVFTPLEELPESTQEQFGYYPDKAKQLMVDAGYPDGFAISVDCYQPDVDLLAVVQAKWEEVLNVDLKINVSEYSVYNSIRTKHTYPETIQSVMSDGLFWYKFMATTPGNKLNDSMVDD